MGRAQDAIELLLYLPGHGRDEGPYLGLVACAEIGKDRAWPHLRRYLDKIRDDAAPLLVTSRDPSANVVVISARDYDNLMENLRIAFSPCLRTRLEPGQAGSTAGQLCGHVIKEDRPGEQAYFLSDGRRAESLLGQRSLRREIAPS